MNRITDTELLRSLHAQIEAFLKRGRVIEVMERDNLQAVIDGAEAGATLLMTPGARYTRIVLPADKPLELLTRGSLPDGRLEPGVVPLPVIASDGTAVSFDPGARDIAFRGIEIVTERPKATAVSIGRGDETSADGLPDNITFDRVWIHANPLLGSKRGIACNGKAFTLLDSVVEDFWEEQGEAQAVCGWNGPGPFHLFNSYLSGSGENVMFGGADSKIPGVAPSLLTMIGNYLHKPDSWRGKRGAVKNSFELKNLRGAVIAENVFSGSWTSAQSGHGVMLTVRNQYGSRPDSTVADVQLFRNLVERVEGFGISIQGWDDEQPEGNQGIKGRSLRIEQNQIAASSGVAISRGWDGLSIERNTFAGIRSRWLGFSSQFTDGQVREAQRTTGLIVRGNLAHSGSYGIAGDNTGPGIGTLDAYAPGWVLEGNAIEQSAARKVPYPANNLILAPGTLPVDLEGSPVLIGYGCDTLPSVWERARRGR